ncbi:pyridine nucleotide-disulfide oxidoreductase family protein, partial [Vibrio parahaemolyticus V-223/04]
SATNQTPRSLKAN